MNSKNETLVSAFIWLFIGLLVCFTVSYVTSISDSMANLVFGSFGGFGYIIFLIAELVLAIVLSLFIYKLPPIIAKTLYIIYTGLTGLSLTGIFLVYTASSITYVFLATAIIFGAFAVIGKTTELDLSKWSTYLFVALLAIIILSIINMFVGSQSIDMFLSIVTILVFCAYVAYDVQHALSESYMVSSENKGLYCAFQLFLDFVNIFIELLRLFGKSRD